MNTSNKIVFFGTEDFSAVALEGLLTAGYNVLAVVTKTDSKKGRGHKLSSPLVKQIAEQNSIPVWQPSKLSDIRQDIEALGTVAGVLVSYGKIIPQPIIDLFTPGIINLHPSLLPKYRGPSPIESAILNGDDTTGVSIMQLSADMDAGPVYHQVELHLTQNETKPHLYKTLADIGTSELVATLPNIFSGTLKPVEQKHDDATYCSLLTRAYGELHPDTMTAIEAERRVRALLGFPKTRLKLLGQDIIVTKAHVSTDQKMPLDVAFRDGKSLSIDELIAPSGKTMSGEAFLKGYKK